MIKADIIRSDLPEAKLENAGNYASTCPYFSMTWLLTL
jgi:hypothetical protein